MPRKLRVVPSPERTDLDRAVSDYLASKRAAGRSLQTIDHYEGVLKRVFLPFLLEQGITEPLGIDQRVLDKLSTRLLDVGGRQGSLSRQSVHTYLMAAGQFTNWLRKEGEITTQAKPQLPRVHQRVLTVLSRDQVRDLEDAASTERDKLIVRILADTGMRLGELLGLTEDSLQEQGRDRYLKVLGKGGKERQVPVLPQLYSRIRRYIARGRPKETSSNRLFLTLRRSQRTGQYEPLSQRAVEQLFSLLGRTAEIPENIPTNPHAMRHHFATNALRKGMGPLSLQRILGHSNLDQISHTYSHLVPADDSAALLAVLRAE